MQKYYTPGIIDITPSIAKFMDIKIPVEQLREMDGTSLIGPISVAVPQATYIEGAIDVSWKALNPKGNVKIWVAAANNFKDGHPDDYQLLAEVPVTDGHALVPVKNLPSSFYKICIEGVYNTVNRWVVLKN